MKNTIQYVTMLMLLTSCYSLFSTPMIRLQLKNQSLVIDETVLYYQNGASAGFDVSYDAYKLFGPNPSAHLSLESSSILFAINGVSPVTTTFTMNLLATTPVTSTYTISGTDFSELPLNTSVLLTDRYTNSSVNLLSGDFVFLLSDTTISSRFFITVSVSQVVNTTFGDPVYGGKKDKKIKKTECKLERNGEKSVLVNYSNFQNSNVKVEFYTFPQIGLITTETVSLQPNVEGVFNLQVLEPNIYLVRVYDGSVLVYTGKLLLK